MIAYIIIGALFTLGIDTLTWSNAQPPSTFERIMCIITWPLTMVGFIIAFIKELRKNK